MRGEQVTSAADPRSASTDSRLACISGSTLAIAERTISSSRATFVSRSIAPASSCVSSNRSSTIVESCSTDPRISAA